MSSHNKAQFYDNFFIFYPIVNLFFIKQKKTLVNEINQLPQGRILDIGVGKGEILPLISDQHDIIGIDISKKMLTYASQFTSKKVQLFEMNAEELTFESNSFDYIILSHVIATSKQPEKLFNEVYRVLNDKGKLIILNHFTPNNFFRYIDKAFNPISTLFHFKSYFRNDSLKLPSCLKLSKEISFGKLNYYKLLIFDKL